MLISRQCDIEIDNNKSYLHVMKKTIITDMKNITERRQPSHSLAISHQVRFLTRVEISVTFGKVFLDFRIN